MDKKYYLVKEESFFYDGHGCPDDGNVSIRVEYTDEFKDLDLSKCYNEDLEEFEETDDMYAEDGYNCQETTLIIKEITKEEYFHYSKIINDYDTLLGSI